MRLLQGEGSEDRGSKERRDDVRLLQKGRQEVRPAVGRSEFKRYEEEFI